MAKARAKVITAMLIFGTIGLFVKNIELTSSEIALYRGFFGSMFLLLVLAIKKKRLSWGNSKENAAILFYSGTAIGLNWILLFEAYRYTTISNATLSYYMAPLFVVLASPFILKEKLNGVKISCVFLAFIGMYFIVDRSTVNGLGYNHSLGIMYGIGAALLYASVILATKFLRNSASLETTIIQLMTASIVLAPYVFLKEGSNLLSISGTSLVYLLFLGVVHTGIAYALYFSAIQVLKGQTIAILSYIDPISAVLLSTLFLSERMTMVQLIGGFFILSAAFLSESGVIEKGIVSRSLKK
ncbi:DMT family transporter [Carnobacterium funditum]|uniref:DMT family transporter n=1 Tax=Carnobacterium funditum TaxID=2752 RepID=UPI000554EC24|nr:DMT family transporter [Carnobacterium funditum]